MDNAFENFMNLLRRKQHGLDDELSAAAEHGEGQSEAVIGDNHEPALLDGVDEAFLRELAAVAPVILEQWNDCLLYTSPSPRDLSTSRMPSSA